ncbi:adenylate kinase [candidate division WWE3 bacterium CG06_land_8_20_14_3_00_42_16]|uniref:Adenylate kinase n=4 Tax=Katanobacteria TaxID=422282 RepID=A0A2M7AMN0_UNCKA|nr:MAG: hypothetical protein AUJ38_03745 [bacterium CG1_02_42_9]PIU68658.1 MAG: adenylate kinase [candidate division WWE3 bacterium CG06_land_8_20_14_3_00_42_16]PIZ43022.1 MAG: adenylate kinase [candidate division WWE3 bacterium CG_4_10_14_0_2_um_filter_42_8]PJA38371.1 MAG: adenylate kinase [candidate division WWE3 bacterium CG_4_9_14_3_um_filter_43_9]PJC69034.1 MAG: adenylate kinase [candidate division WWE3 bacterium CG_4_8_14_3_um_filter_42_11]
MIFIILGSSGAGKGTQAKLLSQRFGNIPTISTGALLRIKFDENTKDGIEAEKYWGKGNWVPDKLMFKILGKRLADEDCEQGFILDAFPRTLNQVRILDEYLAARSKRVDQVIYLRVPEEEVITRMMERAKRDIQVFGKARRDEDPAIIRERLKSHRGTIEPILTEYAKRGILLDIDGHRPIGEIHEDTMDHLRKNDFYHNHRNVKKDQT